MKDYGLVSIITPNYNCGKFIDKTIESVLAQTYQNWELLIQDDCSTDDSVNIIVKYVEQDKRIRLETNHKNSGAAVTRNNAIQRSQGLWLAYLDSDDLWISEKLEKQLVFMDEKGCNASFTRYEHVDIDGHSLGIQANIKKRVSHADLLIHDWFGCLTFMYKQDLNDKIYSENVSSANDYALFLNVMKHHAYAYGLDECLAMYRIRKGSVSRDKLKKAKPYIHVLQIVEGRNILAAIFFLGTHMIVKTFFKYRKIQSEESVTSRSIK